MFGLKLNVYQKLLEEGRKYVELQIDYARLTGTEKLSVMGSTLIILILCMMLGAGAFFYFSFAVVYLLAPYVGLEWSYAIVGAFCLLLAGIILVFRKPMIINPVTRFLSRLLLDEPDKPESL